MFGSWSKRPSHRTPPPRSRTEGIIREGYSAELDELRATRDGARDFIARLQSRERERTKISSLKVGFNKVFGYYLEVTKANLDKVPDDYVRKQTLANAERYFTPELKEWEEKVFGAEDRMDKLEAGLFSEVRARVAAEVSRIQEAGGRAARLDVLTTLAQVAERRGYVRPEVHTGYEMEIVAGRHPVVEMMMPTESFIPNDLALDQARHIVVLTGPNMAGKSTLLRQVGAHPPDGASRILRSGGSGPRSGLRSDLHPCGRFRQPGSWPVDFHGGDERDRLHHPWRHRAEPCPPRRDRSGHFHI